MLVTLAMLFRVDRESSARPTTTPVRPRSLRGTSRRPLPKPAWGGLRVRPSRRWELATMLNLVTQRPDSSVPPSPTEGDAGVTVWRDNDGAVAGYGSSNGPKKWIHLPGVGAFCFEPGSAEVVAFPLASASSHLVRDAFNRSVLPLALQGVGHEVLHASAVLARERVVALCAVSGTGKSTIACALDRRGHPLWADDAVCFDASNVPITAVSLPFALRLRPASAEYFAANENGRREQLSVTSSRPGLGAVVVLERSEPEGAPVLS